MTGMKKVLTNIACFVAAVVCVSCGEDRTVELEDLTKHTKWMLGLMREQYLWGDTLNAYEPEWKDYFAKPDDFLKKMTGNTGQTDNWSYVEVDTLKADSYQRGHFNHINTYGFDFEVMADPTGQTTKSFLRVLTVYPNSPAEEAGLKRDDFISTFDSVKVTANNASKLDKGLERKLTVTNLKVEGEDMVLEPERGVKLPASRFVEDVAFPVHATMQVAGIKVGYLMCSRLLPSAPEKEGVNKGENAYRDDLDAIMAKMKAEEVSEMVLDLRLCNVGTLEMARRLASYVVRPSCVNGVFAKTFWNKQCESNNVVLPYDASVRNLSVGRVFVLTSKYTQGAAEWLIHCLRGSMGDDGVIVVGKPTAGQNVMTQEIGHEHHVVLCPAVAYVADCDGNYNYKAIAPDVEVDEISFAELYEYGNMYEPLLRSALVEIAK